MYQGWNIIKEIKLGEINQWSGHQKYDYLY